MLSNQLKNYSDVYRVSSVRSPKPCTLPWQIIAHHPHMSGCSYALWAPRATQLPLGGGCMELLSHFFLEPQSGTCFKVQHLNAENATRRYQCISWKRSGLLALPQGDATLPQRWERSPGSWADTPGLPKNSQWDRRKVRWWSSAVK